MSIPQKIREPYASLLRKFLEVLLKRHPEVVSVVVFGSVARGDASPTSDVDVLVVMSCAHIRSRAARLRLISDALDAVEDLRTQLVDRGIVTRISPIVLDVEEAKRFRPLYLDLIHDAVILYDRGGFFRSILRRVSEEVKKRGGVRVWMGRRWHWRFERGNPLIELCGVKLIE